MDYTIGMLGPITLRDFQEYLEPGLNFEALPKGLGGSPVNLLSKELLKRGHRMVIITVDPSVKDEVVVTGERLKICVGPDRLKHARDFFAEERKYLLRTIRREKPEVLHAQWTYEYALAAIASGLPYIVTAHDAPMNVLRWNFIPYRIARTVMAYCALWRAKHVVCVSPYVSTHLKRFAFHWRTTKVVPNGLSLDMFNRRLAPERHRQGITFATVLNGWGGYKNGELAIRAFSRILGKLEDTRLLMFGVGHGPGESASVWAADRGIQRGIEFIGQIPHQNLLDRLVNDVDILVHPSLEESHGMALIEAMAIGIPVIGGKNSGGVPWTLDNGRAGILVDLKSPEPLARAMLRLANCVDERNTLAIAGSSSVRKRFSVVNVANQYEVCYKEALGLS